MERNDIELLAPAGTWEALEAAVNAGANAVYLGGSSFGARAYADNFGPDELKRAMEFAHLHGVRIFVTVNTLVDDEEMPALGDYLTFLSNIGTDGIIVQDMGVIRLARKVVPELLLHASTQMTVTNSAGAIFTCHAGMVRAVPARETTLKDLKTICEKTPGEIETFMHGALCICYSGQCLMSSLIGGRSGNRGRCAQPCRLPYTLVDKQGEDLLSHVDAGHYLLSPKDLNTLDVLPQLIEAGVRSFKIEGRMKRPEYVAAVTQVYRQAIDGAPVTQEMMDTLYTAFNRQGFTAGYYQGKVDRKMFGIHEDTPEDQKFLQAARQSYESGEAPLVDLKFRAVVTVDGSSLTATDNEGHMCMAQGPMPERAVNMPLTGQALAARVAKTGGTPFRCVEVRTQVEPGLMLPASAINAMRRDVLNQMTALRARREDKPVRRAKEIPYYRGPAGQPGLTVQIMTKEQLTSRLLNSETSMLYVPLHILADDPKLCQRLAARGRVAAVLPRIVHDDELPKLRNRLNQVRSLGIRDALVGNLGLLLPAKEAGFRLRGDFGLNIFNSASAQVARELKLASATLSFEMTLPQIRDISKAVNMELIAYGRLPLMITEQCLIKNKTGECACQTGVPVKLTDKTGADFPVIKEADTCRSVLLNGKKLYWLDRQNDLAKLGLWAIRLNFTTENAREVDRVLEEYLVPTSFDPGACTRGLYLRGVE